jgi:hypothetical protein
MTKCPTGLQERRKSEPEWDSGTGLGLTFCSHSFLDVDHEVDEASSMVNDDPNWSVRPVRDDLQAFTLRYRD